VTAAWRRLSPLRASALLVIVLTAALWAGTWQRARVETERALAAADRANSNLAIAYEENASNAIGAVDQLLRMVESEYHAEGHGMHGAIDEWQLDHDLVRGVAVLDSDGKVQLAEGYLAARDVDLSAVFEFHRGSPGRDLHIGRPALVKTNETLELQLPISRRIEGPDGSFAGVVLAMTDPGFFTAFYRRVGLGPTAQVSLVRRDGFALARQAGNHSAYDVDMRAALLFERLSANPNGAFVSLGKMDGTPRLMNYRSIPRYPLVVMVGTSIEDILSPVRDRTRLYYLFAVVASALIGIVVIVITRSLGRQKRDFEAVVLAQGRLRASIASQQALTENMAGGVITAATDGRILSVNTAAREIHGYGPGEMVGLRLLALVDESGREGLSRDLATMRESPGEFLDGSREFIALRKDGTTFEAEALMSSVETEGIRSLIGIVHDVSVRKALERGQRRAEALYRATFDQALVGILHTSLDGRFMRVNRTACEILGYTGAEMLALGYADITHAEDLEASAERFASSLADAGRQFEYHATRRVVRKDGSVLWALTSLSLVRTDRGAPDFFLVMIQDITELKRVEQMKDEFVSTVSHELRTPLTSIRGSLGLLAGGVVGTLPDAARNLVLIAERGCERLIRLVNDILDTEQIETGQMQFDLRVAELRPLVERAMESMEGFAQAHQVRLRMEAPLAPVLASVDADRFIQVLTNLISNAVKFSPQPGAVDVTLSQPAGGSARLEVRDRGPGIPKDFHARVFQRFSQADASSARQKGGTGLGLSIAKAIVDHLGGTIGYRTNPDAGTVFFVQLPATVRSRVARVAEMEA
jgi:PAS domain S-box-containing protein